MAGQHDKQKHQIAVKFHHRVWRQIEKDAEAHKMKPGEYIRHVVTVHVEDIELDSYDALLIAERIKRAEKEGHMV